MLGLARRFWVSRENQFFVRDEGELVEFLEAAYDREKKIDISSVTRVLTEPIGSVGVSDTHFVTLVSEKDSEWGRRDRYLTGIDFFGIGCEWWSISGRTNGKGGPHRTVDHGSGADDGTNAKSAGGQCNDWLMLAPWPTF